MLFTGYSGLICLMIIIALSACSTNSPTPQLMMKQATPVATPMLGATGCRPPSPIARSTLGIPEIPGTPGEKGVELWALLFNTVPFSVHQEVKIVWRMTGDDDLQVVGLGPGGTRISPKWITYHPGSNWNRPGAEWGTGFVFPKAGCWDLHATRGSSIGDVWVLIGRG